MQGESQYNVTRAFRSSYVFHLALKSSLIQSVCPTLVLFTLSLVGRDEVFNKAEAFRDHARFHTAMMDQRERSSSLSSLAHHCAPRAQIRICKCSRLIAQSMSVDLFALSVLTPWCPAAGWIGCLAALDAVQ